MHLPKLKNPTKPPRKKPKKKDWVLQGFRAGKKNEVKNIDLWEQLIPLLHAHETHFHWVKGHAKNELNNRCDRLAVEVYRKFLEKGENT